MITTDRSASGAGILERLVEPQTAEMSGAAARYFLQLDFPERDHQRMAELAEKAQAGSLTNAEQVEIDRYVDIGHWLAFLQSKARQTLRKSASPE